MTICAPMLAAIAGALLVVGSAACGGDDDAAADDAEASVESESERPSTSPDGGSNADDTTTTVPASPKAQAVAVYQRGWEAMFTASNPPDPMHPSIPESLTGVAAQTIIGIVLEQQNAGQYTEGSMATRPEVVSVTASEVLLRDCTIETSTTYDAATGAVVEDGPGPPRTREVLVVNQGGTWRVSEIRTLEEPCTPG